MGSIIVVDQTKSLKKAVKNDKNLITRVKRSGQHGFRKPLYGMHGRKG